MTIVTCTNFENGTRMTRI